jgi:hypothetical protein
MLPAYKGAVLRGAFGSAFRRVACPFRDRECAVCLLKTQCAYSLVFESPRPADSKVMRKYETIPRPFVIEPPLNHAREATGDGQGSQRVKFTESRLESGESLGFGLLLIGPAIGYLPHFIYAFDEMARNGLGPGRKRFALKNISQSNRLIYDAGAKVLTAPVASEELGLDRPRREAASLTLRFLTPLRIVYQGRPAQSLDFHVLFRGLARRIGLLSHFHSDAPFEIDYRALIARAQRVKTLSSHLETFSWRRYSTRQDQLLDMDGLTGEVTYQGRLAEFLPLLKVGETVHAGKGTVFGLGKYEMEVK